MVTYCQKTANRIIDNFINSRHQELLDSWLSRGESSDRDVETFLDHLDVLEQQFNDALRLNTPLPPSVISELQSAHPELNRSNSADAALLARRLKLAELEAIKRTRQSLRSPSLESDPLVSMEMDVAASMTASPQAQVEPDAGLTLADACAGYLHECEQRNLSRKTLNKYKNSMALGLCVLGDRDLSRITAADGRNLRATLQQLPIDTKTADFESQTISAILANPSGKPLISNITANDHLTRIRAVFEWAERLRYIPHIVIPSEPIPVPARDERENRDPISDEHAKIIFRHQLFTRHIGTRQNARAIQHPHHFFLPLICLTTGVRLGEAAQLYVEDVVNVAGVHCIKIGTEYAGQRLKTPSAARLIPLHPELIRLEFLDYVNQKRSEGNVRLFPEIALIQGTYSNKPSEWFIKHFRDRLSLPAHVTPHAFRHSFRDKLSTTGVSLNIVNYLMGHANSPYGARYPDSVTHLKRVIDQLPFTEILAEVRPYNQETTFLPPQETRSGRTNRRSGRNSNGRGSQHD